MLRGDLRLGRRAGEMRAFLALEFARHPAKDRDDLAAHIDPGIIVALVARRDDALADEHHGCVERRRRAPRHRAGDIILAEDQRPRHAVPGQHQVAMVGGAIGDQRHVLQIAALVAGRAQAGGVELRRDIMRRDHIFGARRLAALQHVIGEEQHMRLERRLVVRQRGIDHREVARRRVLRRCRARQQQPPSRHDPPHAALVPAFIACVSPRYHSGATAQAAA